MSLKCPNCASTEFDMRASRRIYAPLDENGEVDGWSEGDDFDWDVSEDGKDIIYCNGCDSEFSLDEVLVKPNKSVSTVNEFLDAVEPTLGSQEKGEN